MLDIDPDDLSLVYRLSPTSISDGNDNCFIYPNPASDKITVKTSLLTDGSSPMIFHIINSQGIPVLSQQIMGATQFDVNISNLKDGVYYASISDHSGLYASCKLIVLRK